MENLYIRPGVEPQPLPVGAMDDEGKLWPDLANDEEGRAATGWDRLAPPKPSDTETQRVEWDIEAEEWVMVDRPPEEIPEEPADPDALYLRPGTAPQSLPFEAHDETGRLWTDLAHNVAGREATGWADVAPSLPAYDPAKQAAPRWQDEAWVVDDLPPPPAPSPEAVTAERDRRIDAGIVFAGHPYQSRQSDRENIAGAAQLAFMAIVAGAQPGDLRWADADNDFVWIAEDNSLVPMDAPTVIAFAKTAAGYKQALTMTARAIKDADPIPDDYADDAWWPAQ